MARPSIPRGRVSGNVYMRLTGMKRQVTSLGCLPAVRMAWDTLGMNSILLEHGSGRVHRRSASRRDNALKVPQRQPFRLGRSLGGCR